MAELLQQKEKEHGKWRHNSQIYNRLYLAARLAHDYAHSPDETNINAVLSNRYDHANISMILHKLARVLSKESHEVNKDDWLDIAGYALLRYNELVDGNKANLIELD